MVNGKDDLGPGEWEMRKNKNRELANYSFLFPSSDCLLHFHKFFYHRNIFFYSLYEI